MQGLYIHIPFCVRKCGYCDFYSEVASEADMARFLAALEHELNQRAKQFTPLSPTTIFFGGGTPTRLSATNLRTLGQIIHRHVDTSHVIEWTSEINPGTIDAAKAAALAEMGVNRASFGVQDFDAAVQKAVHRVQPLEQVAVLMQAARDLGFASTNVDLIYGLPLQTPDRKSVV